MDTMEEWRGVPGFEDRVQVSSEGRVRTLRVLKPILTAGSGYPAISKSYENSLTAKPGRVYVHALIAETFLGPRPLGKQINHIDGNRTNNQPNNLEYVTVQGNSHHAFKIGNRKHYFTDAQMDQIAEWFFDEGISQTDIARRLIADRDDITAMRRTRKKVRSVCEIWRVSKGIGKRNPYKRHLSWEDVDRMRDLYNSGQANQKELSKMFSCHPAHVSRIVNGILWPESEKAKSLEVSGV